MDNGVPTFANPNNPPNRAVQPPQNNREFELNPQSSENVSQTSFETTTDISESETLSSANRDMINRVIYDDCVRECKVEIYIKLFAILQLYFKYIQLICILMLPVDNVRV